jgi:hypothetical protein
MDWSERMPNGALLTGAYSPRERAAWLVCALLLVACEPQGEQERWIILDSTESGRPVVISARASMPTPDVRGEFRWVTSVRWYYPITDGGMPNEQQLRAMHALEDEVESHVVAAHLSMLALTRTGNGLREWIYYVKDRRVAEDEITRFVRASAENIQVMVREEPEWTSLHDILSRVDKGRRDGA